MASNQKLLEAQLCEVKAQARQVNEKLRAHRKSAKSRQQREEAKRIHLKQVGWRIIALAHHEEEKALDKWLSVKLPTLQAGERYNLLTEMVDEFTTLDVDNIMGMLEPIAHSDQVLLEEAKAEVAKCELHSWVCQQNIEKGLAPTVGALIQQRLRVEGRAESVLTDKLSTRRGRWASYKWVSRWRKKWSMPKAKIQNRDAPTPSEMREKVRPRQFPSIRNIFKGLVPVLSW